MFRIHCITTAVIFLFASQTLGVAAGEEEGESLWRIGTKDAGYSEFAIAGRHQDYTSSFPRDVVFTIGRDDPAASWPYVHPGPSDRWAGGKKHSFTIRFRLDDVAHPYYRLALHLVTSHNRAPAVVSVAVNGLQQQPVKTLAGPGDESLAHAQAGQPQTHFLYWKAHELNRGDNEIVLTTDGSWMCYDALELSGIERLAPVTALEAKAAMGWFRSPEGDSRKLQLSFVGGMLSEPAQVGVVCSGKKRLCRINPRSELIRTAEILLPMESSESAVPAEITMRFDEQRLYQTLSIEPERKWEVHLVHQTHLDIGYTHPQEDVLQIQVDHLRMAMEYIEASKDYPEEARFKWHPEGMWAVEEFLRTASKEDKAAFVEATRKRDIHIDAMYAQAMTGAYSEEELFELLGAAKRYGQAYGVTVDSAMQSDVPGYTWGLAAALAHHGVRYLSLGPNPGHRIGHTFAWADQPFYWLSPSGKHKVLFWMTSKGYAWFHGSPVGHRIEPGKLAGFLEELEQRGYPYDLVMVRYNIGFDNGPPNPALPDFVKEWNERYAYPKLILSRNSDAMAELERRYGDRLPVVRGDFTPYWEDGMASTAADTGIARRAAEQLVQAQNLWTMLAPAPFPVRDFDLAWNKLIMYDEHTWGAHNSISAPDDPFAVRQAKYKQKYALDGAQMTGDLLHRATARHRKEGSSAVDVYNTLNWPRTELVLLSDDQSRAGDRVENDKGRPVPSQRLATGELAFLAEQVPAFGAKRYFVRPGEPHRRGKVKAEGRSLDNGIVALALDPASGAVSSLRRAGIQPDLVDRSQGYGANDYLYLLGRDASKNHQRVEGPVRITVEDPGPLVGTLRVECAAPGAKGLSRRVRLVHGSDAVELLNVVDKLKERRPEGVYFSFPFNLPGGVMQIDTPWAVVQPEKDQLRGANKNFFVVQRWVDVSNENYGLTWVTLDAPLVQWDPIRLTPPWGAEHFRSSIEPNQTLHSWVMNNHWETNYKADQEGLIPFDYVLRPHPGGYHPVEAQRLGRAVHQPLVAVPVAPQSPSPKPLLEVGGEGVMVTTIKPCRQDDGLILRLFNAARQPVQTTFQWSDGRHPAWLSNPMEEKGRQIEGALELVEHEIATVRVDRAFPRN